MCEEMSTWQRDKALSDQAQDLTQAFFISSALTSGEWPN
jgi:hypothetical protein